MTDKRKCESCHIVKIHSCRTLPWNRETHWMYDKNLKGVALYLIMVGKSKENMFSRLGKDIWLIIMKYVLIPNYFMPDCIRNQSPYCDDCMRRLYRVPPCQCCDEKCIISPCVFPDIKYELVKNDLVEIPALCSQCHTRLYICELHKKKPPFELCYKCEHPGNIRVCFESSFWVNLKLMGFALDGI